MKCGSNTRLSCLRIGTGRRAARLRNRVVLAPMASETADSQGFVTERTLAHYRRLLESGAGLGMVEYTYVDPSGRSEEHQLGIQTDTHVEELARLAQVIHGSGAVAGLQLTHAGGKTERALTGGVLLGASAIPVPVKDRTLEAPDAMSWEQVQYLRQSFVAAAERAVRAGFDLVEFHSAHGYGLNQWLSPLTNQRTDAYGGSLENRARLLLEIVNDVRSRFPGLLLAARIPGQDLLPGGLSVADMIQVSRWLEAAGLDLLDVSSGLGGWRRPKDRRGEGYLVEEASLIQGNVSIPVTGVGGIQTAEYIDKVVNAGMISLAAVGRAILDDPHRFRERVFG